MRIVHIGPYPKINSLIKGGVEASIYGLSNEQSKTEKVFVFDIPRIDLNEDLIENDGELLIFRFNGKELNNITSFIRASKVIKIILKLKPDICHVHTTGFFSFMLFLILRLIHIPVILTVHGLAHLEKKSEWIQQKTMQNLIKYVFYSITEFVFISLSSVLIVDTQYVADSISKYKKQRKIFHLPDLKIIPQGVHPSFYQLTKVESRYNLLSVGAFTRRKGQLILIDSLIKVRRFFPEVKVLITGFVANEDYYSQMQEKIFINCLEENIKIIPNASFEKLLEFYKSSEIFVLHSEEESQGIALCEALACGIPIVTTNSGGIPWVVEHNINGLLSKYGDVELFADNLISLMNNDIKRKKMQEDNKNISIKYEWKNISIEIIKLYKSLLKLEDNRK